ncbi:unnamed protein product [Dicrocoelium dendriticum]|nr:unnamed protein product [Dicrocoelium dendriticum]
MPSGRISTRASRVSEKENVLSTSDNRPHKLARPRQTWTAPNTASNPSTRTPHRASKDLALARLLAPSDLDSSYEREKTPPVNKRCFTAPRPSQRTPRMTIDLHSPLRRLRSLSIHTSADTPLNKRATVLTESARRNEGGKRRIREDNIDSDYGAETSTDVSESSDEDDSVTESEVSSLSDELSDSSSSVEWLRCRRRRPQVKCTPSTTPSSAKRTPRSATVSLLLNRYVFISLLTLSNLLLRWG